MTGTGPLRRILTCAQTLRRDDRGGVLVEFAILAPVIFGLLFGVMQMGLQMFSYNALRAVATDTTRYAFVEYQKRNRISTQQIEDQAVAIAVAPPYGLQLDNFNAAVTTPASAIAGTTRYQLELTYVPMNMLGFMGVGAPTITVIREIYVTT
jgi:Flp pilus assembly protein TadG